MDGERVFHLAGDGVCRAVPRAERAADAGLFIDVDGEDLSRVGTGDDGRPGADVPALAAVHAFFLRDAVGIGRQVIDRDVERAGERTGAAAETILDRKSVV